MARLFVAVWPPEDVVAELAELRRKDRRGIRFVDPQRWHVTLRFFGEADPDEVADALEGLSLSPVRAVFGPAVDILAERALVVPVRGLDELAAAVAKRTAHIGQPPRRRFVGHLTVARMQRHASSMPAVLGAPVSAAFDVERIALVRSRLRPEGAEYETLEEWPVG